ncbi:MAG: DUF1801 domain-containing protein [Flavobacteriales bacterium]|jgi:hypothetical protein|nr:DUF1801 domain-containing protein [Flavobacteriales bacterium]
MISDLDLFYEKQEEPNKSCFLALRSIIQSLDPNITEAYKYKLPFFLYKNKMFCYLWKDKQTNFPYIGVVKGNEIDHPLLEQGNRKKMKVLSISPNEDIPIEALEAILKTAINLY